MRKNFLVYALVAIVAMCVCGYVLAQEQMSRDQRRAQDLEKLQERFAWWGTTDAQPAPVRDAKKGGYWWMPKQPGPNSPTVWGNRGYIYVYKIIFDYQEEDLPAPKPKEMRPSLLIKKILKNVKIYFDYDKADLRADAMSILENATYLLKKNPKTSILITGNCDILGTEQYNEKLGKQRGDAVKRYMLDNGISDDRIKIVSRGKLDAIAPVTDLVGMQKDRNAQFMVAEVEEVMIPYPDVIKESGAKPTSQEGTYVIEKEEEVESAIQVSTKEYIVQKGDTLWKIADKYYGDGKKWKNIYRFNQDKIKDPNKLKAGTKLTIPIE